MSNKIDKKFVAEIESKYFRTNTDTGANENALFVWNRVRVHVGLPQITLKDLPAYCLTHKVYHVIQESYGCVRKEKIGERKND